MKLSDYLNFLDGEPKKREPFSFDLATTYGANLAVHYDASEIVLADGADVTQWDDLSGNDRHLTPILNAPQYWDDIDGFPAVQFTSGTQHALAHDFTVDLATTKTIFVVGAWTSGTGSGRTIVGGYNALNADITKSSTETLQANSGSLVASGLSIVLDTFYIITYVSAGGSSALLRAGGVEASGNDGAAAWAGITVGANSSAGNRFAGYIREVIGIDRVATEQEYNDTERYLAIKWGL